MSSQRHRLSGCPAVKNKRSKRAHQVLLFSFSLAEYRRKHDQQQHRQRTRPARSTTCLSSFLFLLCFGVFTSHNHRNDRSGWLVPHPGGPEITQQSTDETRPSMARTARRSAIAYKYRQCPALPCVYLVRVNSHPAMVAQRNSRYVWVCLRGEVERWKFLLITHLLHFSAFEINDLPKLRVIGFER